MLFCHFRVVCRELGFVDGVRLYSANNSDSSASIAMGYVNCSGQENSIMDCQYVAKPPGCSHDDDVFVQCLCSDCPNVVGKHI